MTYFEDTLREMICYELGIPNIRAPISSDKANNDFYVENEKKVREALKQIAHLLLDIRKAAKMFADNPGVDGEELLDRLRRDNA